MSKDEIEEYDGELPEGFNETLEDVKIATKRINDVLKDYNISVVMSSLSSAVVQAICLTSNDLAEAQTTAANLSVFCRLRLITPMIKASADGTKRANETGPNHR